MKISISDQITQNFKQNLNVLTSQQKSSTILKKPLTLKKARNSFNNQTNKSSLILSRQGNDFIKFSPQIRQSKYKIQDQQINKSNQKSQVSMNCNFDQNHSNKSAKTILSYSKIHTKNHFSNQKPQRKILLNFSDSHLKRSKQIVCKNLTYQKFDITKLDFTLNHIKTQAQLTDLTFNKKKQHSSLITKSRSNIKKIIELNRLLKQKREQNIIKDFNPQSVLDKFIDDIQIIQVLKKGCFGTIYKARIISSGKIIAIKSVSYDRSHEQREQEIGRLLDSLFVIKFLSIYQSTDFPISEEDKNHQQIQDQPPYTPYQTQNFMDNQSIYKNSPKNYPRYSRNCTIGSHRRMKSLKSMQSMQSMKSSKQSKLKNQINIFRADAPANIKKGVNQNLANRFKQSKQNKTRDYNVFHRKINIVMEIYDCDLNDYIMMKEKVDNLTLKIFCYQMLRAVLYVHSLQICHRDIKPHNFLVKKHLLVLTDFGSAKIMTNHKNSNLAYVCSRHYRAPQLILGYKYYDKSIDIWSLGCVMAELCLGKPIFRGSSSLDQLVKIIKILGKPNWMKIAFMFERIPKIPEIVSKGLKSVFRQTVSSLFIDLIQKMLVFNPLHRISAGQALCHAYFDELRDQMNFQQISKQMNINHFMKFSRDELKQNDHLRNKLIPGWFIQTDKKLNQKLNNCVHQ